jgi:periplasmic protein TonB
VEVKMSTQDNQDLNSYQEPIISKMQYGAPELKKFYKKFASRGLIIAVILHAFFISFYVFSLYLEMRAAERELQIKRDIELKDIQSQNNNNDQDEQTPPLEVEPQKVDLKAIDALTPEPVAKEKADIETIKKVEDLEKIKANVSSEGDPNWDPTKETDKVRVIDKVVEKNVSKIEIKENKTVKIYQQFEVDKAPVAVNLSQVQGSMRYPEIARTSGIEGKVTVTVLVSPDGSVSSVGKFNGPDVFREEVNSKVMNLQFTPALQQGSPVKCWVSVPFNFKLSGKFKKDDEVDKKEEKKETKKEENKEEGK